jgi:hypothetical protein
MGRRRGAGNGPKETDQLNIIQETEISGTKLTFNKVTRAE